MTAAEIDQAYTDMENEMANNNKELAESLGVSEDYARGIFYLRTRSRWTQEAENELIRMSKNGESCPNMNEWPPLGSSLRDPE
jgi:hypothetical protein